MTYLKGKTILKPYSSKRKKTALNLSPRHLTITSQYRSCVNQNDYWVPELRLSGLWLKDAGFSIGDPVKIEVSKNQLIITKLSKRKS